MLKSNSAKFYKFDFFFRLYLFLLQSIFATVLVRL